MLEKCRQPVVRRFSCMLNCRVDVVYFMFYLISHYLLEKMKFINRSRELGAGFVLENWEHILRKLGAYS